MDSSLSQEIVDEIVGHLALDQYSLYQCNQVNRSFHLPAQRALFTRLRVTHNRNVSGWVRFIQDSREDDSKRLRQCIQILEVRSLPDDGFSLLLDMLENLQQVAFESPHRQVHDYAPSFPTEHPALHSVESLVISESRDKADVWYIVPFLSSFPHLQRMVVKWRHLHWKPLPQRPSTIPSSLNYPPLTEISCDQDFFRVLGSLPRKCLENIHTVRLLSYERDVDTSLLSQLPLLKHLELAQLSGDYYRSVIAQLPLHRMEILSIQYRASAPFDHLVEGWRKWLKDIFTGEDSSQTYQLRQLNIKFTLEQSPTLEQSDFPKELLAYKTFVEALADIPLLCCPKLESVCIELKDSGVTLYSYADTWDLHVSNEAQMIRNMAEEVVRNLWPPSIHTSVTFNRENRLAYILDPNPLPGSVEFSLFDQCIYT